MEKVKRFIASLCIGDFFRFIGLIIFILTYVVVILLLFVLEKGFVKGLAWLEKSLSKMNQRIFNQVRR